MAGCTTPIASKRDAQQLPSGGGKSLGPQLATVASKTLILISKSTLMLLVVFGLLARQILR